jgi:hypothetical protein
VAGLAESEERPGLLQRRGRAAEPGDRALQQRPSLLAPEDLTAHPLGLADHRRGAEGPRPGEVLGAQRVGLGAAAEGQLRQRRGPAPGDVDRVQRTDRLLALAAAQHVGEALLDAALGDAQPPARVQAGVEDDELRDLAGQHAVADDRVGLVEPALPHEALDEPAGDVVAPEPLVAELLDLAGVCLGPGRSPRMSRSRARMLSVPVYETTDPRRRATSSARSSSASAASTSPAAASAMQARKTGMEPSAVSTASAPPSSARRASSATCAAGAPASIAS